MGTLEQVRRGHKLNFFFSPDPDSSNPWFYSFTFVGEAADGLSALDVPDTNRLIM